MGENSENSTALAPRRSWRSPAVLFASSRMARMHIFIPQFDMEAHSTIFAEPPTSFVPLPWQLMERYEVPTNETLSATIGVHRFAPLAPPAYSSAPSGM